MAVSTRKKISCFGCLLVFFKGVRRSTQLPPMVFCVFVISRTRNATRRDIWGSVSSLQSRTIDLWSIVREM